MISLRRYKTSIHTVQDKKPKLFIRKKKISIIEAAFIKLQCKPTEKKFSLTGGIEKLEHTNNGG